MKVIFLDHDSVICLSRNWGSRYKKQKKWGKRESSMSMKDIPIEYRFDDFDKKAIKVLNQILEETRAEIVVSSDWKLHASVEELSTHYQIQGIIKKPIDVTEKFHFTNWVEEGFLPDHDNFAWLRDESLEQQRHFEIKRWLRDHPEVTHWVAVDDLHMGVHVEHSWRGSYNRDDWGLENFVWTPNSNEGIKQTGIKEQILKYLKDAV